MNSSIDMIPGDEDVKKKAEQILVSVYCENLGFDCKRSGSSKEPLMGLSGSGKPTALSNSLLTFLTSTHKIHIFTQLGPGFSLLTFSILFQLTDISHVHP